MKRIWLVMFTGALLLGGVAVSPAQPGNPADPMERAIGHLEKARAALTELEVRNNPQVQQAYDELTKALEAAREARASAPPTSTWGRDTLSPPNPFGHGFLGDPFQARMGSLAEDMRRMREEMDDLMRRSFAEMGPPSAFAPRMFSGAPMNMAGMVVDMDIKEEGDRYVVTIDLPGVGKDDIKIEARENHLQISGSREEAVEESNEREGFIRRERRVGTFSRTVPLPGPIDPGKMEATHENGVLKITAPKKKAKEEESRIVIVK
jgi:HSP20 family molecular chaperone IbpA